ncbi:protein kinase domain-containing protein (plasmid) [Streptomyces sp. CWNU-52B]|uniref:protein kinase domain-containing protein n=1 Tax=unclassified Streptomyces TaxID=2593676 RepID=UPI0039BEFA1B
MDGLTPDDPGWIGNYRLLGRLGEGGMGRVYLARSDRGRTVAVKVVKEELARKSDFRRRFAQEVKAAQRVGGDWTAPVLDADTDAATPWVATGYVAGPSLATVVDEQYGALPQQTVRALAIGLVRALQAIHGAGLVHRDLKPSNILVTIDGPRVIDFGIARALDPAMQSADGLTMTGVVVGSPGFMSPEQVRGVRVTYASDVFCLGTVLAYTATGRLPFGASEGGIHSLLYRIVAEEPDLTGLPEVWERPVAWCLAKDPEQRPTLEQLLEYIEGMEDPGGAWLPGEVLAELGRHAVQLLNREDPQSGLLAGLAPDTGPVSGPASEPASGRGSLRSGSDSGSDSGSGSVPGAAQGLLPGQAQVPAQAGAPAVAHAAAPASVAPGGTPGQYAAPMPGFGPPVAYNPSQPVWHSPAPGSLRPPSHVASFTPIPAVGSVRELGWALVGLLGLLSLSLLVRAAAAGQVLFRLAQDSSADTDAGWVLQSAASAATDLEVLLFTALAVVWVVWFRRTRSNAEAFAPGRIRHSFGMAAGSWFIPVVCLYMPKQISNDVWTATTGRLKGAERLLLGGWWWSWNLFIVGYAQDWFIRNWFSGGSADDVMSSAQKSLGACCTGILCTALAVLVVRRLSSHQQARFEETRRTVRP